MLLLQYECVRFIGDIRWHLIIFENAYLIYIYVLFNIQILYIWLKRVYLIL